MTRVGQVQQAIDSTLYEWQSILALEMEVVKRKREMISKVLPCINSLPPYKGLGDIDERDELAHMIADFAFRLGFTWEGEYVDDNWEVGQPVEFWKASQC